MQSQPPDASNLSNSTGDEYCWYLVIEPQVLDIEPGQRPTLNDSLNDASTVETVCDRIVTNEYFNNPTKVRQACAKEFKKNPPASNQDNYYWIHRACEVGSGFLWDGPAAKNVRYFQQTGSKVYLYSFDHYMSENEVYRAARSFHNLDIFYIENFFANQFQHPFTAEDTYVRNLLGELLANFAKTGRPFTSGNNSVVWDATGPNLNYLSIKFPAQMSNNSFHADSVRFWNEIAPQLDA